jgi:phosphinothricin acetyltransferase
MILRRAEARDAMAVAAIWNPVIRDTAATFTTQEKTAEGLAADFATRAAEGKLFLVAEEAGELLGFATYFQFRNGPGYARTMEHSIILSPAARGRGLGRALMAGIEDHARTAGVAFHRSVGFAEVARLPEVGFKFGRWMDLVLMQKIL